MHSFKPVLEKYINEVKPLRCLEWGPGHSTSIFLNNVGPNATLLSIEHNLKYYEIVKNRIQGDERWELLLETVNKRVSQYAHCIYNYPKFDFIFVDGRRRVECCVAGLCRLNFNGVMLLHDSKRKAYTDLLYPLINIIEDTNDTLVFKPKYEF
jgi:predicted O-methyltransferase YrrM